MTQHKVAPPHANTRKRWVVFVWAVGLFLGAAAFAPAQWLALAVNHASRGRVLLVNPQGTVWRGQADWLLSGGAGSRSELGLPGGLNWQILPQWHDSAPALRITLTAPCCTPTPLVMLATWHSGAAGLAVENSQSTWPAEWLTGLGTPWNTLNLQGKIQLQTVGLSAQLPLSGKAPEMQGSVVVQAQDLSSNLSTLRPLGSYEIKVDAGLLQLRTLKGDLALSGQGQWQGGYFRFKGLAEATPGGESALSNLLNILGRRDGLRAHINLG